MDSKIETKKKKSFSTFVKEHKREITIGVLTISTVVTGIVIYKKHNDLLKTATEHTNVLHLGVETVKEYIPDLLPDVETANKTINVPEYIRKLPKDYKHSQNAVESAKRLGYDLLDDETFVQQYSYTKISA